MRLKFIRCKGSNDILVVSPRVYKRMVFEGAECLHCNHPHRILEGPAKFVRGKKA